MTRTKFILLLIALLIIGSLSWSGYHTLMSVKAARTLAIDEAAQYASQALPVPTFLSSLTGRHLPDIEIWKTGLEMVVLLPTVMAETSLTISSAPASEPSALARLAVKLTHLNQHWPHSWLVRPLALRTHAITDEQLQEITTMMHKVTQGRHTYVMVFQNSDELRGTGGFMGSFALLTVTDGRITAWEIRDIYEPDGQFTGYIEPPAGVKEYLSSGRGLRLPDANWWPDFPTSAQYMLRFFSLGQTDYVEGVAAINLGVMEKMLAHVGEVFVPDYQVTVTPQNLAQVARADRTTFFPGSTAKVSFLSALFRQLLLKIEQLPPEQKKAVLLALPQELTTKNIQLYAPDPELQTFLIGRNWAGTVRHPDPSASRYLQLVESNVGINKANRGIHRQVELIIQPGSTNLTVKFHNTNQSTAPSAAITTDHQEPQHLHYVNYQRVLVDPTAIISSLSYDEQPLTSWDEEIITTSQGQTFKQVGFLAPLLEGRSAELTMSVTYSQPAPLPIFIQKQAGMPAFPLTVQFPDKTQAVVMESDLLIQ